MISPRTIEIPLLYVNVVPGSASTGRPSTYRIGLSSRIILATSLRAISVRGAPLIPRLDRPTS